MERATISYLTILCAFMASFFFSESAVFAEENLEERFDCTEVYIDYKDDPSLSQEERLRLMDEAFFRSLNRFEYCQSQKNKNNSSGATGGSAGGGSGNGGGSGSEGQEGDGTAASQSESVATSTMTGTEVVKEFPAAEDSMLEGSEDAENSERVSQQDDQRTGDLSKSNGKTPEDIPPAKNDDALAAQIRYAAENEPDPEKRRQLWNEYRKYKGLPQK